VTNEEHLTLSIQNILGGYEVFGIPETFEKVIESIEAQIRVYHIVKKNEIQLKLIKEAKSA